MNVDMICHCGDPYTARQADLDRGWGLSCGKRCAAIRRDFGRPKAKRVDGIAIGKPIKKKPKSFRKSTSLKTMEAKIMKQDRIMCNDDDELQAIIDYADAEAGWDYLCECGDKD